MNENLDYSDFFYLSSDGLNLHARVYGARLTESIPVISLPGLTRNARDFHEFALALSRRTERPRKVVVFEYRGRGQSAYDPDWQHYNVGVEANDILAGLATLNIENGAFVGTSRGGLIMLVLSAMRPELFKAAVFNDIGPVVEAQGLADIRAYLENAPRPKDIEDAVAIQRSIHGDSFPALTKEDWRRFVGAIYRLDGAQIRPDFDPALLNTLAGLTFDEPLPTLWPQFESPSQAPVLVIRGENSRLLSAATVEEMAKRHPGLFTLTVDGQGHAPLLETGDLPERIAVFIDQAEAIAR